MTNADIAYKTIETWNDLLEALKAASPEQLQQPVQVCQHHPVDEYVFPLSPGICLGTVDELNLRYARSTTDNRRHGEHLVIYADYNPFAEDGATSHEIEISAEEGKLFNKVKSIYPKGYDDSQNWTGPAQKLADQVKRNGKDVLGTLLMKRAINKS